MLQYELDFVMILQQLEVLNNTTKSETQSLLILGKSANPLIKKIGLAAFYEKSISLPQPYYAIIKNLEKYWFSPIHQYLILFFKNFGNKGPEDLLKDDLVQNIVSNKLIEDRNNLETNVVVLNSIFSVLPIFLIIFIFIGYDNPHPLLEIVIISLIVISVIILLIDPLRMRPLTEFLGLNNDGNGMNRSSMLRDLYVDLIITRNIGKTLQKIIWDNKSILFLKDYSDFRKKGLLIGNYDEIDDILGLISKYFGENFGNLIYIISASSKVDMKTTLNMFNLFSDAFSNIEKHYMLKKTLIETEKRKSFLILIINSLTLGIMSIIIPFLAKLSNINFSDLEIFNYFTLNTNSISLILIFEFWLIISILYFIFISIYRIRFNARLIRDFVLINCVFIIGVLFSSFFFSSNMILY